VPGERLDSTRGDVVRASHLVDALRSLGHEVIVVEAAASLGARRGVASYRRLARRVLPHRLALVARDLGRVMLGRAHGRRVAEAACAHGAELIVETQVGFIGSGAVATARTGIPLVLDDCSPSMEEDALGAGLPWLARRVLRAQARASRVIVAVTGAGRERLIEEGVQAGKIRIVPNGVDLAAFDAALESRPRGQGWQASRRAHGIPDDASCPIVFVGSFQPWHRVDLLVEALARTADQDVRPCLVLAGSGPGLAPALEAAARWRISRRVTSLGPVAPARIPALLSHFSVGVLPGTNDHGHPMKVVEYSAAGLACVAPDVATVREILAHDQTGLLFPPGDVEGLAGCLMRLASSPDLVLRLGTAARERVAAPAGWTERARRLLP
jgi:glycosyltransferase involved in cell wall biosynthesis